MTQKSDASKKILGFKYQEMVALVYCLEADDGRKIYLECFGDISDENSSIEVKQSINKNKLLSNRHQDFWKTLNNIIIDYDTFRFYDQFILHTTARIKEKSIFENWNEKTFLKKLQDVLSIEPNNTIKKYHETILNIDRDILKDVLDKFSIDDNKPSAKEYYKNTLLSHISILNSLDDKYREAFVCSLLGFLSNQLIKADNYIWEIDIHNFRENFRSYLKHYQIDELEFPISNEKSQTQLNSKFRFITELVNIEYVNYIGKAMEYYLKASDSQKQMIESRHSLVKTLDNYDDEIYEIVEELKISHIDKRCFSR